MREGAYPPSMRFTRTFRWVLVTIGVVLGAAGPAGSADVEAPPEDEEGLVMGFVQQHAPEGGSILNTRRTDDPGAFRVELRLLHNQIRQL